MLLNLEYNISEQSENFGTKTLNLVTLKRAGFNVPWFAAISNKDIVKIHKNPDLLSEIIRELQRISDCRYFAVRSSALIEDSNNLSFAGQFKTRLNVTIENIDEAIKDVIKQAAGFLKNDLAQFSIIIQELIKPDYSGVVFTRNPVGTRECIIEYHEGIGENLVSGKIKPEHISFYWQNPPAVYDFIRSATEFNSKIIAIEELFKFPQDIEWCTLRNNLYILQTRPITTITRRDYEQIQLLETQLPSNARYYFYKNQLSEILSRPRTFMRDLVTTIYSHKGPVAKVYQKYAITYTPHDFTMILGNELYIDKPAEIATILPAYTISYASGVPQISLNKISQIPKTLENIIQLNKLKPDPAVLKKLLIELQTELQRPAGSGFKNTYLNFLKTYSLIFEINLLCEKALSNLKPLIKNEKLSVAEIINGDETNFGQSLNQLEVNGPLIGNSLDICDHTRFVKAKFSNKTNSYKIWLEQLPDLRQRMLQPYIRMAQDFNKLREVGRWLTVKLISELRQACHDIDCGIPVNNRELIFQAKINEIQSSQINLNILKEREDEYLKYIKYDFPTVISSSIPQLKQNIEFVSGDSIKGTAVDINSIKKYKSPRILITRDLSPSLTKYFNEINGIISLNGSMLSHLAIIAREKRIPIMITNDIKKYKIGEKVLMCHENQVGKSGISIK